MTYYRSVMTYVVENGGPQRITRISTDGGFIAAEGTGWTYKYMITDYLGHVRSVVAARRDADGWFAECEQRTDFYPYGMAHELGNLHVNRYLFGGKELQDHTIGKGSMLGFYDFHARYYNPMLGRWFNVDPQMQLQNPYLYCVNNPVMYVDPDGEFIFSIINAIKDFFVNTFVNVWTQGINAWTNGDNWNSTKNALKIDAGLFKGNFMQILSRFTWELPQSLVGYLGGQGVNLVNNVKSVTYYGGATAIETFSGDWGALTLGSFIVGNRGITADPSNSLFQHEYGHYLQSQASGPLYLGKYGIPSLYDTMFGKGQHWAHPTEQDANARALKYFEKKYPGFAEGRTQGSDYGWDHKGNPIVGYVSGREGGFHNPQNQAALKNAKIKAYGSGWDVVSSVFSFGLLNNFVTGIPYEHRYRQQKKQTVTDYKNLMY